METAGAEIKRRKWREPRQKLRRILQHIEENDKKSHLERPEESRRELETLTDNEGRWRGN